MTFTRTLTAGSPRWHVATLGAGLAAGAVVAVNPAAAIAAIVACAVVAATLYAPGVMFAAYLWVPPFFKAALQPYSPVDLTVLLAIPAAAQFGLFLLTPRRDFRARPLFLWVALTGLVAAGSLWTAQPDFGRAQAISWVALVTLPLLGAYRIASDERYVRQFVLASFAAGLAVVILGLLNLSGERLDLLDANPINVAKAALFVPIILYRGWAAVLLVPAALLVAASTGERGPLVALGATAVALVTWRAIRNRHIPPGAFATGVVGLLGFVVALAVGLIPSDALDRFGLLFEGGGQTAQVRLALIGLAGNLFAHSPLIGAGTGGFTAPALSLLPFSIATGASLFPHNAEIQFAEEFGVLGVAMFGLFLVNVFRSSRPDTWAWRSVANVALFTLLAAQTSGNIYDNRGLWGLLLLVLMAPARAVTALPRAAAAASRPSSRP